MRLELRNVHYYPRMSEETNAFDATVYMDGKPAFMVSNRGTGGCDDYAPVARGPYASYDGMRAAIARAKDFVATQTYVYEGETEHHDLETYVGELLAALLEERDMKRNLACGIIFTTSKRPGVYTVNAKLSEPAMRVWAEKKKAQGEEVVVLNLLPLADAIRIAREATLEATTRRTA